MKFTNKWMVVPYNPKKFQEKTVSQSLSNVLKQPKNPIDKVKEYNQILVKNSQNNHPVVPSNKEEQQDTTFDEESEDDLLNTGLEMDQSVEDMDITMQTKPSLSLPPPFKLPTKINNSNPSLNTTMARVSKRMKRSAPYPSPKKTRGYYKYKEKNYLPRPDYDDSFLLENETKEKNGEIIELDKSRWEVYK